MSMAAESEVENEVKDKVMRKAVRSLNPHRALSEGLARARVKFRTDVRTMKTEIEARLVEARGALQHHNGLDSLH